MIGDFTKSELAILLRGLSKATDGKWSKADYEALMSWATDAKLNGELLELVLDGYVDPYIDEEGILKFVPTEKGLASDRRQELERMRV